VRRYAALHDPRRRSVYEYVRSAHRPVSRDEVADAVGLGRPLAVFHLERLLEAWLVAGHYARAEGRAGPGAGRPTKWYTAAGGEVSVSVPPRRYVEVGTMLAAAIEQTPHRSPARDEAVRIAGDEGRRVGSEYRRERPGRIGRPAITELLGEIGFEPSATKNGPITLMNCPFHRLAQAAPQVICAMNQAFVAGLLDGIGAEGFAAALDPGEDRCCVLVTRART
jgi:predicted ArsR family transcriptional regulator